MSGSEDIGVEVWRGGVNTWECDEMGYMNVRFYVVRALEGLVGLASALGMPRAFSPTAGATLLIREQHIRFLREALAGAALHMRAWVAEMGECDARLVQVLYHASGEPAASFQTVVSHVTPMEGRAFPWTDEARRLAETLVAPIPDFAAARSVDLSPVDCQASVERADALGLAHISSGAVLEYRLIHLDWPRAGDRIEIRSGLARVDRRTQRLVHWMVDPDLGRVWGAAEAVTVTLDLDKRKIVPVAEAAQAELNARAIKGLTL